MPASLRSIASLMLLLGLATLAPAAEIPTSLRAQVLAARERAVVELSLAQQRFFAIATSSQAPFILWPADPGTSLKHEVAPTEAWLESQASVLGHGDFTLEYIGASTWWTDEVWSFRLVRERVPVFDASVRVHWAQGRLVGLVNDIPFPLRSPDRRDARAPVADTVYVADREAQMLRLARIERTLTPTHERLAVVSPSRDELIVHYRQIVHPADLGANAVFEEYRVPVGSFPDQIDVDSLGNVWFTQPNDDLLTALDPLTKDFHSVKVPNGSGPDGMLVDARDELWSGLYFSGRLGRLTLNTGAFRRYVAPYSPASLAVPLDTSAHSIWITDHLNNRISEFDPVHEVWLQSLVMPTASCWVTAGTEEPTSGAVYFTEFNANNLGRKTLTGPIEDLKTPGGGPAFPGYAQGKIYYSEWNRGRLGCYDPALNTFAEYTFPKSDVGGPLGVTPSGKVVVGTRNVGYIFVFDPATQLFAQFRIPTPATALKDGLIVARDGTIWFTESGIGRIARLELR